MDTVFSFLICHNWRQISRFSTGIFNFPIPLIHASPWSRWNGFTVKICLAITLAASISIWAQAPETVSLTEVQTNARAKLNANGQLFHPGFFVEACGSDENGSLETVRLYLVAGMSPDAMDSHNQTALAAACKSGRADVVKALIESGASVNTLTVDSNGENRTALMVAAGGPSPEVVNLLLQAGASVIDTSSPNNWTPLFYAIENGRTEHFRLLVRADSTLNQTDSWGLTPLHRAVFYGHTDMVQDLIELDAPLNSRVSNTDETPLVTAVTTYTAKLEIVQMLVEAGADIHIKCGSKQVGLLGKIDQERHPDIATFLKEKGLRTSLRDQITQWSIWDFKQENLASPFFIVLFIIVLFFTFRCRLIHRLSYLASMKGTPEDPTVSPQSARVIWLLLGPVAAISWYIFFRTVMDNELLPYIAGCIWLSIFFIFFAWGAGSACPKCLKLWGRKVQSEYNHTKGRRESRIPGTFHKQREIDVDWYRNYKCKACGHQWERKGKSTRQI